MFGGPGRRAGGPLCPTISCDSAERSKLEERDEQNALQPNGAEIMLNRLLNKTEEITDARLRQLTARWDARTFAKVRLADVLQPDQSDIPSELFRFALQSHFDFTVSRAGRRRAEVHRVCGIGYSVQ